MNPQPKKNMAASVKQRLLNLSKERGEDFNFILGRYAAERFLFRLSRSAYGREFTLKGAMLFHLREMRIPYRPTHDLDLLGTGTFDIARMETVFKSICRVETTEDGLVFPEDLVRGEEIREHDEYLGIRLRLQARMGSARVPLQVDVGFGDAVTPGLKREKLLTLLDLPAPSMPVYPWETVVAEKFQAMAELGMDNSRMKDYFDIHYLAKTQPFSGATLAQAIQKTFARRKTALPEGMPTGLLPEFAEDAVKQTQWNAFIQKLRTDEITVSLDEVINLIKVFLSFPVEALRKQKPFKKSWKPGGPWE